MIWEAVPIIFTLLYVSCLFSPQAEVAVSENKGWRQLQVKVYVKK